MLARQSAQVVHPLEDNEPAHAGRCKHIAIEARQSAGPEAIVQKMVAANALV